MEVTLLSNSGIGDDNVLSIRAGTVRRQAPISTGRPFRFPKFPNQEHPLKIDILRQVGTAYLVQRPGSDQRYKVDFGGNDLDGTYIELDIQRLADGALATGAADGEEADEKDISAGAKAAKEYLEGHQVLPFVQAVLQTVIRERPPDPFAYMAKRFTNGYGLADARTLKTPAKEEAPPPAAEAAQEDAAAEGDASAKARCVEALEALEGGGAPEAQAECLRALSAVPFHRAGPPADAAPEAPAPAVEATAAASEALAAFPSSGPVDISDLTRIAKDDLGLLRQPAEPLFKTALAQIYVRSAPYGGSDKSSNGHRYDSIPIANGMIKKGMSCQLVHYVHDEHDKFFEFCTLLDAIIVRCNPGQIKADGGDQAKFDDGMREMRKLGKQVWPSPDVVEFMGAKDALCKVATLNIGLEDTLAYYSEADFAEGFKKSMAFQPRVIKNRGSSGEGIWIIKKISGNYCSSYGERSCEDDEELAMMEANDNHVEVHTVAEFIEFCVNGRTDKSGEWTSTGVGKYLEGGKEGGGQLVDQRFCPRIVEGELRYNMVMDSLVGIVHKKPKEGGISAVGGSDSIYTFYGPEEKKFANLTENFLTKDLKELMPALGLADEPIPLWWTTDFILASEVGTPPEQEKWTVGEFNCSCVGISKCLAAHSKDDTPNACYTDIAEEDLAEAQEMGDLMGGKALRILRPARSVRTSKRLSGRPSQA